MRACNMPGRDRSLVKRASPVTLARASIRGMGFPMTSRSLFGGNGGGRVKMRILPKDAPASDKGAP